MRTNYSYRPEKKTTSTSSRRGSASNVKIGRTIAQEWERQESESERLAARKKGKTKKSLTIATYVVGLLMVAIFVVTALSQIIHPKEETEKEMKYVPTVDIIDENGAGVPNRMRDYIGQVERDFSDMGYSMTKAVVPAGKSREVDVYLLGIECYFKLNIDRDTAMSAEDAVRMSRYLEEQGVEAEYVDVRVEGKGYYKGRG